MRDDGGQLFFSALANQIRCRILRELESGEKCVNDLVRVLKIKQSLVSHNLKILIKAGLVRVRRAGTFRYYTANRPVVSAVFGLLSRWEVDRTGGNQAVDMGHELNQESGRNSALFFFKLAKDGTVLMSQGVGFEGTGFVPGSDVGAHFSASLKDMPDVIEAVGEGLNGKMINKHVSGRGFIFGLRVLPLTDKDGRPDGCVGVVYDISERLKTMWQLRAAEARWKSLMMSMPAQAALIDTSGRILFVNRPPALVPQEKVIGMIVFDWFSKTHSKVLEEAVKYVVETGEPKYMELMSSGSMDGQPSKYAGVLTPVQNNGSKPKELVIVFKRINGDGGREMLM